MKAKSKLVLLSAVILSLLSLGSGANAAGIETSNSKGASDAGTAAGNSQGMAQMASYITAGMMAARCSPHNTTACMMAALAAAQGGQLGKTKAGSYLSADAFATDTTKNGSSTGGASATEEEKIISGLAGKGATLSPDGTKMNLPDGTTKPLAAATSLSGLSAAGFSADQVAQAQNDINDAAALVNSKLKNAKMDGEGGGGGGIRAPSNTMDEGGGGGYNRGAQYVMVKRDRKKAVSGLSKNLGNDKIGVSGDNIFEMITRRYKAKDAADGFVKN